MISSTTNSHVIYLCIFLVCCYCYSSSAKDNITIGESINDGLNPLESEGMKFQMGFFSPGDSLEFKRYVGIWYKKDPKIVVWVANREKPVLDSTGVLTVAEDGNFKVLKNKDDVYFTTNTEGAPRTTLKLWDTGNAVLLNVETGDILWQSFENPTDTFLPGMKMGTNIILTSWKSATDPGPGNLTFHLESDANRYNIMQKLTYIWKSRNMSTSNFDDNQISTNVFNLLSNITRQRLKNRVAEGLIYGSISYETVPAYELNSRLVMNYSGKLQYFTLLQDKNNTQWVLEWEAPKNACLDDCTCQAYSYSPRKEGEIMDPSRVNKGGCWFWNTDPNNLNTEGTHNISFRVSESSKGTLLALQLVALIACMYPFCKL